MFLHALWEVSATTWAIDLGTSIPSSTSRAKGIVLNEPSVVAIRKKRKGVNKIICRRQGGQEDARPHPERVEAICPMKEGDRDFEITEIMLRHFIRQVLRRRTF